MLRYYSTLAVILLAVGSYAKDAQATNPNLRKRKQQGTSRALQSASPTTAPQVRWVSSGGGWRSMVADMGFANALARAGLFSNSSSSLSAMSSNSGGSWFSTQFFYSAPFFNAVAWSTPDELYTFVYKWMETYLSLLGESPQMPLCSAFAAKLASLNLPFTESDLDDMCNLFGHFNGSWAAIVDAMLDSASSNYGDDSFTNRSYSFSDKVAALQGTELYVQTSLSPTSRANFNASTSSSSGDLVYLTLSSTQDQGQVYTVPLAAHFAAKLNRTFFNVAADGALSTMYEPAPSSFSRGEYENYFLYPGTGGTVLTTLSNPPTGTLAPFQDPFGGSPTVSQVASASSAALGGFSGDAPSVLAQATSMISYEIQNSGLSLKERAEYQSLLNEFSTIVYSYQLFGRISVCSQWPSECSTSDSQFIDGAYTDGLTLALNIGEYQTVDAGDLSTTLKVIVTNNNYMTDSNVKFLSYFQTDFNAGVAPGDYLWAPSESSNGTAAPTPWRSYQIFSDYLDDESLDAKLQPIVGTNLTYALVNATTLDNAAFGVRAGQKVEMLLLQINSPIPTTLVGRNVTQANMVPLADMAESISNSTALMEIVQAFVSS